VTGQRRRRAWTTRPLLLGGSGAVVAWLFGVVPADALLIGVLIAIAIAVPHRLGPPQAMLWHQEDEQQQPRSWAEPARLARLLGSDEAMRHVLPRAAWTARQRVAGAGLSWEDTRVRAVLGRELHDVLSRPDPQMRRPPDPARWVNDLLDRLDQLDAPPPRPHDAITDEEPRR